MARKWTLFQHQLPIVLVNLLRGGIVDTEFHQSETSGFYLENSKTRYNKIKCNYCLSNPK